MTGGSPGATVSRARVSGRWFGREAVTARTAIQAATRVERLIAFVVPFAALLIAGSFLALHYHSVLGDAASREANAYYVFFSNDPHLAAIGFVWNPLTSVSEMPLILLKGIWPALTSDALAANIMSSVFMAGACYQIFRFMEDIGVRRVVRWVLLACFLANPMVFYYGANGMSEALFIFTLVATTRRLAGWLEHGGTRDLVGAAFWLGLAYAARNEAALAAVLAFAVVVAVSLARSTGSSHYRRMSALTDGALLIGPFALSFLGWALTSEIIVGHFFEQLSSIYGNAAQVRAAASTQLAHPAPYLIQSAIDAIAATAPLMLVVLAVGGWRTWRERDLRILAPLAVFGGVQVFLVATFAARQLNVQLRYFMYAIPLTVLLAGFVARPLPKSASESREEQVEALEGRTPQYLNVRRRQRKALSVIAAVGAVALVVPGLFTTDHELFHSTFGALDADQLTWVLYPGSVSALADASFRTQFAGIQQEAAALDALHAPRGGIMVDDAVDCIPQILLASKDPREFTIPNDANFSGKFGAPYQFGVRYIIASNPGSGLGGNDSVDLHLPGIYQTGAGLGTLVTQIQMPSCVALRLYKLNVPSG